MRFVFKTSYGQDLGLFRDGVQRNWYLGLLAGHLVGAKNLPLAKCGLAVLKGKPEAGGMELKLLIAPKAVAAIYEMA